MCELKQCKSSWVSRHSIHINVIDLYCAVRCHPSFCLKIIEPVYILYCMRCMRLNIGLCKLLIKSGQKYECILITRVDWLELQGHSLIIIFRK